MVETIEGHYGGETKLANDSPMIAIAIY